MLRRPFETGASLHLILRRLRKAGISDPTPADTDQFIIDTFGPNRTAEKYFAEYYNRRIAALHPESRFGSSAFAPLEADDYFDLYDDMLEVDGFLLLQESQLT